MERQELLERASFGKQVELFWGSAVGQYLENRALEEYTQAITELKTVDPTDFRKVLMLQSKVWRAESFKEWLSQAVTDGLKSLDLIDQEEAD